MTYLGAFLTRTEIGQLILVQYDTLTAKHQQLESDSSAMRVEIEQITTKHQESLDLVQKMEIERRLNVERVSELNATVMRMEAAQSQQLDDHEFGPSELIPLNARTGAPPSRSWIQDKTDLFDKCHQLQEQLTQHERSERTAITNERLRREEAEDKVKQFEQELEKTRNNGKTARFEELSDEHSKQRSTIRRLEKEVEHLNGKLEESSGVFNTVVEITQANAKLRHQLQEQEELLTDAHQDISDLRALVESNEIYVTPLNQSALATPVFPTRQSIFGELESAVRSSQASPIGDPESPLQIKSSVKPIKLPNFEKKSKKFQEISPRSKQRAFTALDLSESTSNVQAAKQMLSHLQYSPTSPLNESRVNLLPNQIQLWSELVQTFSSRLSATSTTTLNRRLKKSFDINELTQLSNAIIANILADVKEMSHRFVANTSPEESQAMKLVIDRSVDMLNEYGSLRKTYNEISLAYVSKLEKFGKDDFRSRTATPVRSIAHLEMTSGHKKSWSERVKDKVRDTSRARSVAPSPARRYGHNHSIRRDMSMPSLPMANLSGTSEMARSISVGQLSRYGSTSLERISTEDDESMSDASNPQIFSTPTRKLAFVGQNRLTPRPPLSVITSNDANSIPQITPNMRSTPSARSFKSPGQKSIASTVSHGLQEAMGDSDSEDENTRRSRSSLNRRRSQQLAASRESCAVM